MQQINGILDDICKRYKVKYFIDESFDADFGKCFPEDGVIYLSSKFKSSLVKLAVFMHELSHILIWRKKTYSKSYASIFQEEFDAWRYAQKIYMKLFNKPFSKSQACFLLECLKSYSDSQYSFKNLMAKKKRKKK